MTQKPSPDGPPDPSFYLAQIFEKFEEREERLGERAKTGLENIKTMLQSIRDKGDLIFDTPQELYKFIDAFKPVLGDTTHFLVYIEFQRKKLSQPELLAEQALRHASLQGQQALVPGTISTLMGKGEDKSDYGFWHYMGERRRDTALEKVMLQNKEPQMTATIRQEDPMNYARDIPPELNRLYDWLRGSLLRIQRFKTCEKTRSVSYAILQSHLEKLATHTIGCSDAMAQLRQEMTWERHVAYAQAMTSLEQTRLYAQYGIRRPPDTPGDSIADLISAIRNQRGST